MRILVTGSEGTLGWRLCEELEKQGHEVCRVDLQHARHEHYFRADVGIASQIEAAFALFDPELVYHLAAEFGRENGELWYEQLWTTNVIGTRNVLEMCARRKVRLIFASSSEIYGEGEGTDGYLREELSEEVILHQPNEYALSKWVNEVQIRNFVKRHPEMPEPIVCRFFNAYGPGEEYHDYRSVVCLFSYRALTGQPFRVFEGYHRTFMFVDDFIPTLARVAERGTPGRVYNIGGTDFRSVEELAEIVVTEAGASTELIERVGQDVHNVVSKRPDIARAEVELGHAPRVVLEDGVPETIEWMRARYGL